MRVIELAQELKVDAGALIALLRQMRIPVSDADAEITSGQHAKVLAKVERERRAGHEDPSEAIQAAMGESAAPPTRRRRRKVEETPEPEPTEEAPLEAEAEAESEEAGGQEAVEAVPESVDVDVVTESEAEVEVEVKEVATAETPAAEKTAEPETAEAEEVVVEVEVEADPVEADPVEAVPASEAAAPAAAAAAATPEPKGGATLRLRLLQPARVPADRFAFKPRGIPLTDDVSRRTRPRRVERRASIRLPCSPISSGSWPRSKAAVRSVVARRAGSLPRMPRRRRRSRPRSRSASAPRFVSMSS
jgi:hypothetical protein